MKEKTILSGKHLAGFFIFAIILTVNVLAQNAISADELLAKHLSAIGETENRKSIKSTMIVGTSKATFKGRGAGVADGIVVLASEGEKNLIGMKFNNADYPFEMMSYDGNKFSAKQVRPGTRSVLGDFLRLHESVFKGGIMGGTLSQSWSLLNFDEKKGRIKYAGIVTLHDKKLYKLNYIPKKGSDLDINFFFDVDNFQHLRTEYKRVLSSSISGGVDNSAKQSETRYAMIEEFSDFRTENKLNLPHNYQLSLEIISGNGTISYEWKMDLQKFIFNQPIDQKQFDVDSY
ncbi:MAG TPA: hypothetical protein PKY82_08535 [Pyrinomonadaceae bacterium]|nr:hypothetical protein [Pyrinomonadaceae bacterium]